jgi:hypothetical protein
MKPGELAKWARETESLFIKLILFLSTLALLKACHEAGWL